MLTPPSSLLKHLVLFDANSADARISPAGHAGVQNQAWSAGVSTNPLTMAVPSPRSSNDTLSPART